MDSSELLEVLFQECEESHFEGLCSDSFSLTIASLLFALVFKIIMSAIAIGIQVPAGILYFLFLILAFHQWCGEDYMDVY